MLPSTGRVSSTNASRSKPKSNTKNDRIPQPSSRSKKNKVEAHHRMFKSSANKNNHVSDCNANVRNVALSKNSDTICLSCNECLFSVNHDACVVKNLKNIPTGRTFNLVGKPCSPSSSHDTSTIVVPPGHILTTTLILIDVSCPRLSHRYANARGSISKCMLNMECHPFNLHYFGFEGIIQDKELPPWKFNYLGIVEIVLWYLDSGCSKHMIGPRDKLINFVSKFIGTVRFGNDHFTATMGYGDLQIRNILISRVYYVEGLGHNLFSVGQFGDSDLEVAFRKHTCFVQNLEGVDLLSGSHGSNLYTISMADMMKSSPIYLLSKASKTKFWLWHRQLSHLNFGTINKLAKQGLIKRLSKLKYRKDHLCSACQMGRSKKESHPHKPEPSTNEKLQMLHMDLCRPMLVESINKKRYILVIVDDYSRFIWVKFLRTKDEAPEIIIKFLKQAQVSLNATIRYLRTDNDTEFLNQTLRNYTEDVGITHNTSTVRTPQQNGVVERRNRMLVEAARTMLIFSKSSISLWVEAVTTACYTQNRSPIHTRYNKTPYEVLRDRKPELKYLYVFGALCYPTNDFEDLGKLQPKADIGIFISYSPSKKAWLLNNSVHRPKIQGLTSGHISSGLELNRAASTSAKPPTKNDCDLLFQPMFDEYFKSLSAISTPIFVVTLLPSDTAGASSSTTIDQEAPSLSNLPNIEATNSPINSIDVEPNEEVA
ncbi:retrovirus-related pol polyprotein from transposon TNT 1-94 [Tanacetum coccineum]